MSIIDGSNMIGQSFNGGITKKTALDCPSSDVLPKDKVTAGGLSETDENITPREAAALGMGANRAFWRGYLKRMTHGYKNPGHEDHLPGWGRGMLIGVPFALASLLIPGAVAGPAVGIFTALAGYLVGGLAGGSITSIFSDGGARDTQKEFKKNWGPVFATRPESQSLQVFAKDYPDIAAKVVNNK